MIKLTRRVSSLGHVGYGPAPNRCCQIVAERSDVCLIGNHDLVALGTLDVTDFNEEAAAAALWTRAADVRVTIPMSAGIDSLNVAAAAAVACYALR